MYVANTGAAIPPVAPTLLISPVHTPLNILGKYTYKHFGTNPAIPKFVNINPKRHNPIREEFFTEIKKRGQRKINEVIRPTTKAFFTPILSPTKPKNIVPVSVPKPAIVIRVEMTTVLTPLSAR